jgi:hypothetical protein
MRRADTQILRSPASSGEINCPGGLYQAVDLAGVEPASLSRLSRNEISWANVGDLVNDVGPPLGMSSDRMEEVDGKEALQAVGDGYEAPAG